MRRRLRIRRLMKWTATAACALLFGMWLFTQFGGYVRYLEGGDYVNLWQGSINACLVRSYGPDGEKIDDCDLSGMDDIPGRWGCSRVTGAWTWRRTGFTKPTYVVDTPGLVIRRVDVPGLGYPPPRWACRTSIPLWIPLVVIAIPTGFLWWRDRRRVPPDHCQKCGYDLTGNVSGVCPECGTPVERERKTT